MTLARNILVVLAFAWVVRALLDARQVTWPRLVLAVLGGTAVGATVATLLVIDLTAPLDGQLEIVAFEGHSGRGRSRVCPVGIGR